MDFSIGDLARLSGVKVPTIRYYEQAGLLPQPLRTEGNQRRFGQPDLERLQFIRHARDLGLPMEAIRDLLELSAHPEAPATGPTKSPRPSSRRCRTRLPASSGWNPNSSASSPPAHMTMWWPTVRCCAHSAITPFAQATTDQKKHRTRSSTITI